MDALDADPDPAALNRPLPGPKADLWSVGCRLVSSMMTTYDDVMRTIIELPEDQLTALDAWRSVRGVSRAEAIRRAVSSLLASDDARREALAATRGLWAGSDEDGLAYQQRLRGEWEDR